MQKATSSCFKVTIFFWKLELRSLLTFFLQANIYSRVGNWQEKGLKLKMLPNWSLHPKETHGVTTYRVLRTQNIGVFVELEETKLFSFVNVNSKNHIFIHASWWPFLLMCLVLPQSWNSSHLFLFSLQFQMRQTAWGLVPVFISTSILWLTSLFLPGTPFLFKSLLNPIVF